MGKTIFKEIIIVLLLCLAIILVLGILLYEYVPIAKTVPSVISYTTPEAAKEELSESENIDEDKIVMTYETDATDLNNYKKVNNYKPGKSNPFSSYETNGTGTTVVGGEQNEGNSNNTQIGSSETNTSKNDYTQNQNYFPDKGIK